MRSLKRILFLFVVSIATIAIAACEPDKPKDKTYTYNDFAAGTPTTWNPHTWETNEDSYIMGFAEMGLYDFVLNSSKDGYDIIPEMAAKFPVDVTDLYKGDPKFGVPAEATTGYAFKIALNEEACWENGAPINADTYIYSMQQLLDPKMQNYRADSYYAGQLQIANAENYFKQNAPIYTSVARKGEDGNTVYDKTAADWGDLYFSTTKVAYFFGANSMRDFVNGGYNAEFSRPDGSNIYADWKDKENRYGYIKVTEDAIADLKIIAANFGDASENGWLEFCFYQDGMTESVAWDNVGLIKTGEYEITLVLKSQITDFYLKYNLSSNWIVYKDLYEAGKTTVEGFTASNYGTSLDTYMSYGPYKLTTYQTDKRMTLEKNNKWYGYTDGKHTGQFQTTKIDCQIVPTHATALAKFLKGELDGIGLDSEDMTTYRTSDYISYTPQSYTTKLSFNGDFKALEDRQTAGVNKTILSYTDFRKAISLAIDREAFATECTASHVAGFTLLNYMYVSDPETGVLYRNTEQGQNVIKKLYGIDDVSKINGYDKATAQALITKAYDAALKAGHIKANDKVEIEFSVYQDDKGYQKIVSFINSAVAAACVGTPLEGKVTIKMKADAEYYEHMQAGKTDMIMSTWGGAAMNPFGITDCYVSADRMFEYGFNTNQELAITIDGKEVVKSLENWNKALNEGEYVTADLNVKLDILSAIEYTVLNAYYTTPIYYRTVAALDSRKIKQGADEYVQLVGFGGIRFMTYKYTDEEWAKYCSDNNYNLTY